MSLWLDMFFHVIETTMRDWKIELTHAASSVFAGDFWCDDARIILRIRWKKVLLPLLFFRSDFSSSRGRFTSTFSRPTSARHVFRRLRKNVYHWRFRKSMRPLIGQNCMQIGLFFFRSSDSTIAIAHDAARARPIKRLRFYFLLSKRATWPIISLAARTCAMAINSAVVPINHI